MPSDVFWTGLFTFGGGAVGAIGAYLAAKSSERGRERELELELERHDSQELHWAAERDDGSREKRRAAYAVYLEAYETVWHIRADQNPTAGRIVERWEAFVAADIEVGLVGSDAIAAAAVTARARLAALINDYDDFLTENGPGSWGEEARLVSGPHNEGLAASRDEIVALMRRDLDDRWHSAGQPVSP